MKISPNIGPIHFVGIGGIGMSGIAEVLQNLGYIVQGSDVNENENILRLKKKGIHITIGHRVENLADSTVVVISSAIKMDNIELIAARKKFIPVIRRAEMLAEIMRFKSAIAVGGTHGKTTTTSIIATLLEVGQKDPIVINGGIINGYGTNTRTGKGDWMVVEADESDGTFIKLPADVVVVTNIDPEHLDYYGNFLTLKTAFQKFVENIPFYGFAVMCIDNLEVQRIIGQIIDKKIITYGKNPQADVRFFNVRPDANSTYFDILIQNKRTGYSEEINNLVIPMPGSYNVSNATAAIAVAFRLGISIEKIRHGLSQFSGIKRRFTHTGSWNGIEIYDDYGHHPVEISNVLRAARNSATGRVIAIVQPHRYTRLESLFDDFCTCFNDADTVIVTPIYQAGEIPIEGINHNTLATGIRDRGHRNVLISEGISDLASIVMQEALSGDYVMCLGAGSISQWAYALPDQLKSFQKVF